MQSTKLSLAVSVVTSLFSVLLYVTPGFSQSTQSPARTYDEARIVYLGNLARREFGIPPLRWNQQLTEAARWFSWDSVENRAAAYCGHQDTEEHWPDWRAHAFGYRGYAGAENSFCGHVTPEQAIAGWLNSSGHRANLFDPNSREIGVGNYLRESDDRGYATQDFGHDPVYPPVIIENEALTTPTPQVNLYIYNREPNGGFAGLGPATQMMISNNSCFNGASWEPYTAEKSWTLSPGQGWRSVYVKTRDVQGRTVVVKDSIYLGQTVPLVELGNAQMSTAQEQVTFNNLTTTGLPHVQFSLNWLADDTHNTFALNWGNGERVNDVEAWGGTAFRLRPGNGESSAWVWTTEFIRDTPLVAYFRLKVNDNTSPNEIARISIRGGGTEYGPLTLKGTDFTSANHYQEFPLVFTFSNNPDDSFLIFNFARSGAASVFVDAVSIFTTPEPVTSPFTWTVPGGNYRGQGVWLRYTNGSNQFSPKIEATPSSATLELSPSSLVFLAAQNAQLPSPQALAVRSLCQKAAWQASSSAAWLQAQRVGDSLRVSVNQSGLNVGTYQGTVIVETGDATAISSIPVTLIVAEKLYDNYLLLILRN